MTLADESIAALRASHDELADLIGRLTDEHLDQPSGASEWDVAQVLSHLGSGGEIALAGLTATLTGGDAPEQDYNQSVWDRWNAMGQREKADSFVSSDKGLVSAFEALTDEQRSTVEVKLGFLPFPLPIEAVLGMRLNEVAQHSWDVRIAFDDKATLDAASAGVLVRQFNAHLNFLLGFTGKADAVHEAVALDIDSSDYGIAIGDAVSVTEKPDAPTATFVGELESLVRLLGGRLAPEHTPAEVVVSGNVTLDDLRRVFPGY